MAILRRNPIRLWAVFLLILTVAPGLAFAQSTDVDVPLNEFRLTSSGKFVWPNEENPIITMTSYPDTPRYAPDGIVVPLDSLAGTVSTYLLSIQNGYAVSMTLIPRADAPPDPSYPYAINCRVNSDPERDLPNGGLVTLEAPLTSNGVSSIVCGLTWALSGTILIKKITVHSIDLSITKISLEQPAGTPIEKKDDKGRLVIATLPPPDTKPKPKKELDPIRVNVTVNLTGKLTVPATTRLVLIADKDLIYDMDLDLNDLQQGPNQILIDMDPPTASSSIGSYHFKAIINPYKTIPEKDYSNNTSETVPVNVMVLCDAEKISGKKIKFFSQAEDGWAGDLYGIPNLSRSPGSTMKKYGCSISDMAMLFNWYGVTHTPLGSPLNQYPPYLPGLREEPMTPGSWNHAMANYRVKEGDLRSVGFDNGNDPDWIGAAQIARASGQGAVSYGSVGDLDGSVQGAIKAVQNEICAGNAVILKLKKKPKKNSGSQKKKDEEHDEFHFVIAKAIELDGQGKQTFRLSNPGAGNGDNQFYSKLTTSYPSIKGQIVYHGSKSDPSMIEIWAPPTVEFVVTDPMGRRYGFDPTASVTYQEIPGANYAFESVNTPAEADTSEVLVQERRFTSWENAIDGTYSVQVFALSDGDYYLDYASFDSAGDFNGSSYRTGHLSAGQSTVVTYVHSTAAAAPSNASLVFHDYSVVKLGRRHNVDRVNLKVSGKISRQGNNQLNLEPQFKFTIGGPAGYGLTLRSSEFKQLRKWGKREPAKYVYHRRGIEIMISSSGEFSIDIKGAELPLIDPVLLGQIRLEVGETIADSLADLTCHWNMCHLRKVNDHGSCQKLRGHR